VAEDTNWGINIDFLVYLCYPLSLNDPVTQTWSNGEKTGWIPHNLVMNCNLTFRWEVKIQPLGKVLKSPTNAEQNQAIDVEAKLMVN